MESILVTTENLVKQAGNIEESADFYMETYKALLADVDTLTSTDYVGDDATAFKNKVYGFEDDFQKMKDLMDQYAAFLRNAAATYENTQRDITSKVNQLQS